MLQIIQNNFITLHQSGIMLADLADKRRDILLQAGFAIQIGERLGPGGLRGLQIRREASEMSLVGSTPIRSRHTISANASRKRTKETLPEKITGRVTQEFKAELYHR